MRDLDNKFQKRELALYKTYKFLIQNHDSNFEEAYRNVRNLISNKKEFAKIFNEAQKYASVYLFFRR